MGKIYQLPDHKISPKWLKIFQANLAWFFYENYFDLDRYERIKLWTGSTIIRSNAKNQKNIFELVSGISDTKRCKTIHNFILSTCFSPVKFREKNHVNLSVLCSILAMLKRCVVCCFSSLYIKWACFFSHKILFHCTRKIGSNIHVTTL